MWNWKVFNPSKVQISSFVFTKLGVIIPLPWLLYVFSPKIMIMLVHSFNYCKWTHLETFSSHAFTRSAEIEVTVDFLIEIDKLIQLIESPIFTCTTNRSDLNSSFDQFLFRSSSCTTRCRNQSNISTCLVWFTDVITRKNRGISYIAKTFRMYSKFHR